VLCGVAGGLAAAAIALVEGASWSVAALCASDVAALVFVVWVWWTIARADPAETSRVARAEDASRAAAEAVLIGAGFASLVAVVFTLAQAGNAGAPARGLLTAVAIGSVALAWLSVHTVYVLRYAPLYYSPPQGGIDFHGEPPDYVDFAYLGLTVGMTFQVSDTELTGKRVRRTCTTACCHTSSGPSSWRSRSAPSPRSSGASHPDPAAHRLGTATETAQYESSRRESPARSTPARPSSRATRSRSPRSWHDRRDRVSGHAAESTPSRARSARKS
jgi:uncharacterized membrane protein